MNPKKARKNRPVSLKNHRWGDAQKLEAVKCWLITGNLAATAAALAIPLVTLKSWRYSDWWSTMVRDLKQQDSMALTARLKNIAAKSLDLVEDRLENGDWILNQKTGKLEQKPINIRDLAVISNNSITHITKLEESIEKETDSKKALDQLTILAQKFEEFAKKKAPVQVTDVIYIEDSNAIHEKREA